MTTISLKFKQTHHHPSSPNKASMKDMEGELKSYAIPSLLCLLSLLLLLRYLFFNPHGKAGRRLPPGPVPLPLIGHLHLHLLGPIPHQAFQKLALSYGPFLHLRLGSVLCVVASSALTAKELLKTHELTFSDRPQSKAVSYLTYGSAAFAFAPHGPYWKFMKRICMSELLGSRTLDNLLFVRHEEVSGIVQRVRARAEAGEAVDVHAELIRFNNNVICRMTTGRQCADTEGEAAEVRRMVEETAELFGRFNLADYIGLCRNLDLQGFNRRLEDLHRRFDQMMEEILREKEAARRAGGGGEGERVKDILDILLDIAGDERAEIRLSRNNIKAFILDMFTAGTDTSAITIEWTLAELINNPTIIQKSREEIDAVVGKKRLVEESDIPNLPYLQAIVKETLRLHPAVPMVVRESNKDCIVNGYDIPARTRLFVNVWAIGRDPEHWPNPLEFRPERFLEDRNGGIDVRGQHFHFLPFGSGRRGCPGTSLALQVVQPVLAAMIQCFEWKVSGGGPVDMTEAPGLTVPRAHPLVCTPVSQIDCPPLP